MSSTSTSNIHKKCYFSQNCVSMLARIYNIMPYLCCSNCFDSLSVSCFPALVVGDVIGIFSVRHKEECWCTDISNR